MAKECNSTSCTKEDCAGCSQAKKPQSFQVAANEFSQVKKVIGVISGKGGVGKSFVTASLANMMAAKGYQVGIMDADITGPSIPKMYGIKGTAKASDDGIYPMMAQNGIKVMSINLLLPTEETPVIWRGPVLANTVKQFWTDVIWGDLDYLFVENYSYVKCPDCGKEIKIFGESHIEEIAQEIQVPILGKMPIDMELARKADCGAFHEIQNLYIEKAYEVMPK